MVKKKLIAGDAILLLGLTGIFGVVAMLPTTPVG